MLVIPIKYVYTKYSILFIPLGITIVTFSPVRTNTMA